MILTDLKHVFGFCIKKCTISYKTSNAHRNCQCSQSIDDSFQLQHTDQLFFRHSYRLYHSKLPPSCVNTVHHSVHKIHDSNSTQNNQKCITQNAHQPHILFPLLKLLFITSCHQVFTVVGKCLKFLICTVLFLIIHCDFQCVVQIIGIHFFQH